MIEKNTYGTAIDLGTTTIACYLWDITGKRLLGKNSRMNPQAAFGADIVSRMVYCEKSPGNFNRLREKTAGEISGMIFDLCKNAGIDSSEIKKVVVAGNTVMSHIFAGCSIAGLSRAPFEPAYTGSLRRSSRDIGLDISEDACLLFVPAIGGYVGGDVTAGLLSSGVKMTDALTLYIDFGTNGEIVLLGNGAAYVCSAAAGPAFGRAGLLGSGMIDAVADMLGSGIIDETGKFVCGIERRSCEAACNSNEKGRCYSEITQKHIRDFQLAKGAVVAGTEILLKKAGKNAVDIERAVLSGVFGSSINPKSALDVKLLPQIAPELIEFAGNLAGEGASEILIEPRKLKEAEKIAGRVEHIELADEADFQELFIRGLNF